MTTSVLDNCIRSCLKLSFEEKRHTDTAYNAHTLNSTLLSISSLCQGVSPIFKLDTNTTLTFMFTTPPGSQSCSKIISKVALSPLNISVCLRGDLRGPGTSPKSSQLAGHRDDMTHLEYSALWKASTFTFVCLLHLFYAALWVSYPIQYLKCNGRELLLQTTKKLKFFTVTLFVRKKSLELS